MTHAQYVRYCEAVRGARGDAHLADRSDPTTLSCATWRADADGSESRYRFVLSWSDDHGDALYQEVRDDRWHHEDDLEVLEERTGAAAVLEWEELADLNLFSVIGLDLLLDG